MPVRKKLPEKPKAFTGPAGIMKYLQDLQSRDQLVGFDLRINHMLAPQSGPKGLYDKDRQVVVVKQPEKIFSEAVSGTQRGRRKDEVEQSTANRITLHKFERPKEGVIRIPLGGPRGILMTWLYSCTKKITDMKHLSPGLAFLTVSPDYVDVPINNGNTVTLEAGSELPAAASGWSDDMGVHLPVHVRLETVWSGFQKKMRDMAYEYVQNINGMELSFHNSAVAPLSDEEWGLIFHALNTMAGPPTGRSSVVATPKVTIN